MLNFVILLLSVAVGVVLSKFILKDKSYAKLLLTFSGAYFLAITVLQFFPAIFYQSNQPINYGLIVLLGVLTQILLETISKGAEHGHFHLNNKKILPIGIFVGLGLHAFFEGIPISNLPHDHLLWAIVVHKIPESMILFTALTQVVKSNKKLLILMILFALITPLGSLLGNSFLADYRIESLAFVAGIFLHISTIIIFESSDGHEFKFKKFGLLLLGFILAYLSTH